MLLLLLALPLAVPAEAPGPAESALLLALENPESYLSGADLDAIARAPQEHLGVKLLLRGSVLAVLGEAPQFEYALSPEKDPARTSPKVKAAALVTAILSIIAGAVAAIPQETWATLGDAGVPVGLLVGGGATALAAYLKRDPAREPEVIVETQIAARGIRDGGQIGRDRPRVDQDRALAGLPQRRMCFVGLLHHRPQQAGEVGQKWSFLVKK